MGLFSSASLIAAQKSFSAVYRESFDKAEPAWPGFVMLAPSGTSEENYQWLGTTARIKEWIDKKTIDQLRGFDWLIKNKDWEGTISVKRKDFEDDKLGLYTPRIQELGVEARAHPDELLDSVRVAGISALCYDGQFFYDTDHVEGDSGAQSNIITGAGITAANIRTDYFNALAKFRTFKDDRGRPRIRRMGSLALKATIPANLEAVFDELNNPAAGSTVPKTRIDYTIDPYLTDVSDYYYDYVGAPVRAFILQMRKEPMPVEMTDTQAELVFMQGEWLFGVEARYNVGYGLWYYGIKVTNAG